MKKILFFVTAAAVTMSSFAPMTYAAKNKFDVESETAVIVPIDLKTGVSNNHLSSGDFVVNMQEGDTSDLKFVARAEIDMTGVAETWNEYMEAGIKVLENNPIFQNVTDKRGAVLDTATLTGTFMVTITPSSENISMLDVPDEGYLKLDDNTDQLFDLTKVTFADNKYTAEFTVAASNEALDTFFNGENKVLGIQVNSPNATRKAGSYTVKTVLDGTVIVTVPTATMTATIDGNKTKKIEMKQIETVTALPSAKPVPTAAAPAPTDPVINEINVGESITNVNDPTDFADNADLSTDSIYGKYTDKELSAVDVKVNVSENTAKYGKDFYAKLNETVLAEEEYENILNGHLGDVSDAVKGQIGSSTLSDIVDNLSILVINDKADVKIAPVYKFDENKYDIVEGLGTNISAAATPEPTRKPSSGGGGGGGSVVTPKPTATAAPTETPDPNATPAPGDSSAKKFIDVAADAWYNEAVYFVYNKGLMNGTSDITFEPTSNVTRAMAVTVLYRLTVLGETPEEIAASPYSDVELNQWYSDAVAWGTENGIIIGYDDGTFKPNANILRQDFALIMKRYAEFKSLTGTNTKDAESFGDWASVSGYAQDGVKSAVALGLVQGDHNNNFNPAANITRAEMAIILQRLVENYSL